MGTELEGFVAKQRLLGRSYLLVRWRDNAKIFLSSPRHGGNVSASATGVRGDSTIVCTKEHACWPDNSKERRFGNLQKKICH